MCAIDVFGQMLNGGLSVAASGVCDAGVEVVKFYTEALATFEVVEE